MSSSKSGILKWAVGVGFLLTAFQVSFTWVFAPKDPVPADHYFRMVLLEGWDTAPGTNPLSTGYRRFNNWDSLRFFEIAQNGYHIPDRPLIEDDVHHYRANLTTPPAYPALVRLVQDVFHLQGEIALLIAAQLACWVFWIYFLMFLREKGVSQSLALTAALAMAVHPAAFYLVVGYTESLLLASMAGLLYWTERWLRRGGVTSLGLASLSGFIGTATRIAGFPIVLFPVLAAIQTFRNPWKEWKKTGGTFLIAGTTALGLISFFIYCYFRYHEWNIYFRISAMVGQAPNYFIIFDPLAYIPRYFFENTMWSINRTAVPWSVGVLIACFRKDLFPRQKLAYYGTAIALLYFAMTGKALSGMDGMIRYTLPVFMVSVLTFALVFHERKIEFTKMTSAQKRVLVGSYLFALATQGWIAWKYLHGRWVS